MIACGQGLNEEQRGAVFSEIDPQTPILVLAGAGCGKTTVLTHRIIHIAGHYCRPDQILALTFTRKAAEEMSERVAALLSSAEQRSRPLITTFHGFGLRILKDTVEGVPNYSRLGYTAEPALLSAKEKIEYLVRATTKSERQNYKKDVLALDALIEKTSVSEGGLETMDAALQSWIRGVVDRVNAMKRQNGAWEFADMIRGAIKLLQEHEAIARVYRQRFRAVLVDEFQDTNPLQLDLLKLMLSTKASLFVVGDDDQAIYGFRGADITPTLHFGDYFPGARILKLQTNYRSSTKILQTANRIFKAKAKAYRKVLQSGLALDSAFASSPAPRIVKLTDEEEKNTFVLKEIRKLQDHYHLAPQECALLFRLNQTLDTTRSELHDRLDTDVAFLTIHASKGLEFPAVFLCDLEEGVFPHVPELLNKPKSAQSVLLKWLTQRTNELVNETLAEEKRLFYVGVTRAKHALYLISVREKMLHARTCRLFPSRFLKLI
ncbi:MAG: AAA family ATPase [Chitinivibrionales bacterium]|nr:AAA family ATPase [Chitinivibrionales bacterium]